MAVREQGARHWRQDGMDTRTLITHSLDGDACGCVLKALGLACARTVGMHFLFVLRCHEADYSRVHTARSPSAVAGPASGGLRARGGLGVGSDERRPRHVTSLSARSPLPQTRLSHLPVRRQRLQLAVSLSLLHSLLLTPTCRMQRASHAGHVASALVPRGITHTIVQATKLQGTIRKLGAPRARVYHTPTPPHT